MKVFIKNDQKDYKIDKKKIKDQVFFILKNLKIFCDEIGLYFVDIKKISSIHKKYFNDDSPTDCISFPIDYPKSKIYPIFLGEIFICPKIAKKYSKKYNTSLKEEMALYLIHGILHLIGYKDILKKDKTVMQKKEKECMNLLKANGLI